MSDIGLARAAFHCYLVLKVVIGCVPFNLKWSERCLRTELKRKSADLQSKASDADLGFSESGILPDLSAEPAALEAGLSLLGEPKIPDPRMEVLGLKMDVFSFEGDGEAVGLWFTAPPPPPSVSVTQKS